MNAFRLVMVKRTSREKLAGLLPNTWNLRVALLARCYAAPMTGVRAILLGIVLIGCTSSPAQTIDVEKLKGAWWKEGEPSFTWLIKDRTILMEFDMKEHPYRLEGNVLIIDFEDAVLGVQRKRILRLTDYELEIKDEDYEVTEVLRKMKDDR